MYVCVCLYLIQIHISEPIGTKLCTRLPLGLEETVGYVWARNSWPLRPFGLFFLSGNKMAAEATVFRDTVISVVPAGVRVTSPTVRYCWRRSHPPQSYIRELYKKRVTYPTVAPSCDFKYQLSQFPTFSTDFVGSGCRFLRGRRPPAPHCPATALYPCCGASWCDVTGVMCTVRNA
jgi:hypothetical protein